MKKNWIYEVIVTSGKNFINAAPMGISTRNFRTIKMKTYKTSQTYENLIKSRKFIVNFTDDVGIFFKSLKTRRIKLSDSYLKCMVTKIKYLPDGAEICGKIVDYNIKEEIELINRANYLVVESLIKLTKIPILKDSKSQKEDILENYRVVRKVAPKSKYENMMKKIISEIK